MNQKLKHEPHKNHFQNIKSCKIYLIIILAAAPTVNSWFNWYGKFWQTATFWRWFHRFLTHQFGVVLPPDQQQPLYFQCCFRIVPLRFDCLHHFYLHSSHKCRLHKSIQTSNKKQKFKKKNDFTLLIFSYSTSFLSFAFLTDTFLFCLSKIIEN